MMAYLHRSAKLGALLAAVFATGTLFAQPALAVWPGENGKIVFWQFSGSMFNPHAQIFSMDSDGFHKTNLSSVGGGAPALDIQPSVSPNGKRIAFARFGFDPVTNTFASAQVWTMKMDGSDKTNISNDSATASESGPSWTNDGANLLFVRRPPGVPPLEGTGSIWIRKANGKGTPRQLTAGPFDSTPAMSPDGDLIAFSRAEGPGNRHLWLMNPDGSGQTDLGPGSKPDWSPDGTQIAFGAGTGFGPITVLEVADPSQQHVMPGFGNEAPAWSPDGTEIVFIHCTGMFACEIWMMTASFQVPHAITNDNAQGLSDQKPDWQRVKGKAGEGGEGG